MSDTRPTAEQACRDLMARYCALVDARRHVELAELFAPEGELHIAGLTLRGPAEIQAFFDNRAPSLSVHLPGAEWVDPNLPAGHARGGCSAAVFRVAGDPAVLPTPQVLPTAPVVARYEDSFAVTAQGWRFSSRRVRVMFVPA